MKPITITVIDGRELVVDRLVIDDTGTGPQIRLESECLLNADRSAVIDVRHRHCRGCSDESLCDRIGLTNDEADILTRWRTRKEDGVSAAQLGAIFDKVVKAINAPDPVCHDEHERILLRVESGNG